MRTTSKLLAVSFAASLMAGAAFQAHAVGEIISPTGAVINVGGPGFGTINDTFNHAGLITNFVSGVTNFNAYIGGNPLHDFVFINGEWFSNLPSTTATVTYDLGGARLIDRLALWNEDASGIGRLSLLTSLDNITFSALGAFSPTDNPLNVNYGPDTFSFATTNARYVRFVMTGCPQAPSIFDACAIGEVGFRVAEIPEPETYALMLAGLGVLAFVARRSRKA